MSVSHPPLNFIVHRDLGIRKVNDPWCLIWEISHPHWPGTFTHWLVRSTIPSLMSNFSSSRWKTLQGCVQYKRIIIFFGCRLQFFHKRAQFTHTLLLCLPPLLCSDLEGLLSELWSMHTFCSYLMLIRFIRIWIIWWRFFSHTHLLHRLGLLFLNKFCTEIIIIIF